MESKGKTFRRLLAEEPYLFTGGIYSPLDAPIAEQAGQQAAPHAIQPRWLNANSTSVPQRHRLPIVDSSSSEMPLGRSQEPFHARLPRKSLFLLSMCTGVQSAM